MVPMIEVNNLSFRYDHRLHTQTLNNITFTAQQGEWLAIAGHNGSGKSTLAQLLVGLLDADEGSIHIAGIEMNEQNKQSIRRHIGIVFQNPDNQFVGTSVQDDVAFALENINMPYAEMKAAVDRALDMVGLADLRLHDPSRLSGGQKQRVAIAGIVALKPSVIVLDEAFVMLDPKSRRDVLAVLKQLSEAEKVTILSITHDMNEAAMADRIIVLQDGSLTHHGKPDELFSMELGLAVPFSEQLRRALSERHDDVPKSYMSNEDLVKWYAHYINECHS